MASTPMDIKIEEVSDYLPRRLVELKALYGILSKGDHELSEEEFLEHYGVVKLGIELILDERLADREAEEKEAAVVHDLGQVTGKLRNR